jgi:hypothetical protein
MEIISQALIRNFIHENPIQYRSSHRRLCLPIINRIYRKMKLGIRFTEIKIDEGLICDGHHRYIASLLSKTSLPTINTIRTSASLEIDWSLVNFDENDWDTKIKINLLNQQDALYNNISLELLLEILK